MHEYSESKNDPTPLIPKVDFDQIFPDTQIHYTLPKGINLDNIKFEVTGQRFGEKVHEDLLSKIEAPYAEQADIDLVRLYPLTSEPICGELGRYSSSMPDHFLSIEEFTQMIEESPA